MWKTLWKRCEKVHIHAPFGRVFDAKVDIFCAISRALLLRFTVIFAIFFHFRLASYLASFHERIDLGMAVKAEIHAPELR